MLPSQPALWTRARSARGKIGCTALLLPVHWNFFLLFFASLWLELKTVSTSGYQASFSIMVAFSLLSLLARSKVRLRDCLRASSRIGMSGCLKLFFWSIWTCIFGALEDLEDGRHKAGG
jgi:hypothetical protein